MASTFCAILTAYLLGRFVLPAEWMIKRTGPIGSVLLHGVVVMSASYLLLGMCDWRVLFAIFLTAAGMSAVDAHIRSDSAASFLADLCVCLVVSLVLAGYFPETAKNGWWIKSVHPDISRWYFASLSCVSGIVLCVPAGGVLISRLILPFTNQIRNDDIAGLAQGGQYIGWLERILVMLFVLMGEPNGIGFLIAAKSILRFGEIKDASQRKVAEYIIIGTFLSFGWALLTSVLTRNAIRYWIQ